MKRRITMIGLAILLSVATLSSGFCTLTTFAGQKDIVVKKTSFSEEISTSLWNCPESDVLVEHGKIIFPGGSTEETRLITIAAAQENKRLDELFRASVTMKLTSLPENEKFAFAFGLASIEAYQGNTGNVEIAFSNQNGLMVETTAYTDGGNPVVVTEPIRCGGMNSNVTIEVVLMSGGKLTLKVGGKTLCTEVKLPVSGEGNIGFVQTGNCGAQISDVNIVVYQYDAPQNCNIEEYFDNGAMNTGVFSSKTVYSSQWYPQSLSVQEYNGNPALKFERCGLGYIGTKHVFSNFEMTFDVPYLQRVQGRNENGDVIEPTNANFVVSFGGDSVDYNNHGYDAATDAIVFSANSHVTNRRWEYEGYDENYMIYSNKYPNDKGFSVKVSVIDGVVTVGLKWIEEKDFKTVLQYTLASGTPTGYVHLWTTVVGNMVVDNIKITNMDKEPELIEVKYQCDSFDRIADFSYEESELVFREDVKQGTRTDDVFKWYNLIIYAAVAGVVILAGGFGIGQILKRKRNKQIGGKQDET